MKANLKKTTFLVLMSSLILLILWDLYAVYVGGDEATISNLILVGTYRYPFVSFLAGFICGHLFWRANDTKDLQEVINAESND